MINPAPRSQLLPNRKAAETTEFFGPIKYYLAEDEKPEILLRYAGCPRFAPLRWALTWEL
jgi:hypothetical protein